MKNHHNRESSRLAALSISTRHSRDGDSLLICFSTPVSSLLRLHSSSHTETRFPLMVFFVSPPQLVHQFNLKPSKSRIQQEVRKQKGDYAEAFVRHEAQFKEGKCEAKKWMEKLKRWREALEEAANLAGMALHNHADGNKGRLFHRNMYYWRRKNKGRLFHRNI
ncbi:uncharacterized protein LOC127786679 isoform X3 [Diospyros lotus]|uniref:uncharacterized protein LOC127786679 isoform X3 n=1 Tax=Diospyros lotus TaxID=55363 RepID=UPI00224DA463|nr:uncharacterized protein LOC127786679 isoform X3 [Diospyros lotus]